ncbi:hypothetical protein [Saccharicrinis sp. GN24d3]|uniref:hypothetical protein n=1 Tax=Saccharicrinis sp. GN24d3 TaxID=3458416 RepID=UPI004036541A
MRKLTLKSILFVGYFIVFFAVINVVYTMVIINTDYNFIKRLETLNFREPDFKLLVLGASTSFDGIDTGFLTENGITSYNTAIGGANVRTNYVQLKEYLDTYAAFPEYVILGLNSNMVKSFDDEGIHPIVECTMKDHEYRIEDVPILKYRWLGFELIKKIVSKTHREATMILGQLKFRKTIPDRSKYRDIKLDLQMFRSSYWISEISNLCDANGIKLIVVEMPGYKKTQNNEARGPYLLNFPNGHSAELFNLNSRAFSVLFDAEKDWIGNSHLNEYGAIKLTRKILEIVNMYEDKKI